MKSRVANDLKNSREQTDTKPTSKKQVGIWIRVSTEDQARGESPRHHELRARSYAELQGWEVARVYDLSGVSGKTVSSHPETRAMREDIVEGRITGLVFSKLARLARNTRELLDFADFFEQYHAHLISLQECIDTSSPAGRFFYTVIGAMAQWEREETVDRVNASIKVRAKLGKSLGGPAPFGYLWKDGKLEIEPSEAPIRRLAFELFREHKRIKTVANLLNAAGHRMRALPNRSPGLFTGATIKRLIEDPMGKGMRRANYTKNTSRGKHWVLRPESEWVWSEVPAIVSVELWDACNALLNERKAGHRPARRTVHLFSGLVFCHCGEKMYVPTKSPKYVCFACRHKVPVHDLETVFVEQLRGFFLSPEDVAQHLADGDAVLNEKQHLLRAMEADRSKILVEAGKLYQLYLDGAISSKGFAERNQPLESRLSQINDGLPVLQAEIDFMIIHNASSAEMTTRALDLYGHWQDMSFEERRTIVDSIVQRVEVGNGAISFDLQYLPTACTATVAKRDCAGRDSNPRPSD